MTIGRYGVAVALAVGLSFGGDHDALAQGRRGRRRAADAERRAPRTADEARATITQRIRTALGAGATSEQLRTLLAEGSTGTLPASTETREALAARCAEALAGRRLAAPQAAATAEALGAAACADGLGQVDLSARRAELKAALEASGATLSQSEAAAAAFDRSVSEQQQENLRALAGDLQAIQAGSQATPEQVQALADSLKTLVQGSTRPDPAKVDALAQTLASALDDGELSTAEQAQLARDVQAVLASASVPPAEVQAAIADAKALLEAADIDSDEIQAVVADLKAIQAARPARGMR